ncbi:response regulator [Hoeflea sp. AS60]|uniref:response regulator n=1 Tax=Hoeflea sp. AS60 TaxID=3135780 RepID=UPI00317CA7B3
MTEPINVLYVDDEDDIREIAVMSLELDPDITVKSCSSGPEALETLQNWLPDLILLDAMMPGIDGPETMVRLRQNPVNATIPVVFITARSQPEDIERFIALGALGVISKPFDPMTLPEQARALLASVKG